MMFRIFVLIMLAQVAWFYQVQANDYPPRWVELELEEVDGATAYELEFLSKTSGKSAKFKTETTNWRAKVKPGRYDFRLRSFDARGVPGPWSDLTPVTINFPGPKLLTPSLEQKVATDEDEEAAVSFTWENIEGLPYYRVEVKSGGQTWSEILQKNEHSFQLPVGQSYEWTVYALQDKADEGEPSEEPGKFQLFGKKLSTPKIKEPIDQYVSEITWEPVKHASSYTYILSRLTSGKWQIVNRKAKHTEPKLEFPMDMKGGQMKLQVRADHDYRSSSDIASFEFPVFEGSRDPASIDQNRLRDSIEKPTNWYAIASYYVTPIQYRGVDILSNGRNTISISPLGGTGRLGAGYFRPKEAWGFIGLADLSGFTLDGGKTVTYPSLEAHGAWRKYYGVNQLRLSGGVFNKSFVEVYQPIPTVKNFEFREYDVTGVHAGFDFWHPINFKYGIQLNGRVYLPVSAGTPGDFRMTPSYMIGFMGSYRLMPKVMGFAGYAYRVDTLKFRGTQADAFQSNPLNSGDPDQDIRYTGHYLNLLLEWGF